MSVNAERPPRSQYIVDGKDPIWIGVFSQRAIISTSCMAKALRPARRLALELIANAGFRGSSDVALTMNGITTDVAARPVSCGNGRCSSELALPSHLVFVNYCEISGE